MDIKYQSVSHQYKSIGQKDDAIIDINLEIEAKNEFIAVIGHTGSGKSTLVQHLNALLLPTSGVLTVFGQNLPPKRNQKINFLRRKVGLVFQFPEYQLFEETVIKDIMFGPSNFKETKPYAKDMALKAASLIQVPETMFEQSPFRISGGQMRRVAVAGILAMNPDVLVLDEPTRGLDPKGRKEIMDIFLNIHETEKKTIIMITHDMDLVSEYAKRVIVLNQGRLVFDGKKEALFEHPQFDAFHLDYPTPIKIMKHLEKTVGIPYQPFYTYESMLQYLKGASYE